jgi:chromate transporter
VKTSILATLGFQCAMLALLSFGGGINTVVPELQRQAVDVHHWMDASTFSDLFAIAQASPGPNMLIVCLVGLKAAGIAGALVATVAATVPTCLLTFVMSGFWDRIRNSPWRPIVQGGVAPVAVGLISASAYLLSKSADHAPALIAITVATAAFCYFTKRNPLWALGAAAVLGLTGVVS